MNISKSQKSEFICQSCSEVFPKWLGQCSACGEWNSLVEQVAMVKKKGLGSAQLRNVDQFVVSFSQAKRLATSKKRFSTQIGELDRVLGGGLVPGMAILLGGEPGVGKSTLLTQMVIKMLESQVELPGPIIYVSGEESPAQISLRVKRILIDGGKGKKKVSHLDEKLMFVTTTDVDEIIQIITQHQPWMVIVDSIQTIRTIDLTGASGSVGQVRESTDRLVSVGKALHVPIFFVGHVTKDGAIAGPKVLEHIVDSVIELSGERTGSLRLLRALKNRYGATDEVGVFQIVESGLEEVTNPSQFFMEHANQQMPGNASVCVVEGTRPLLVEVQALVLPSQLAMPRRVGRGIELSRIQVLAAVMQKHARLPLGNADIFVNAAGGFKITEPAVDLGLAVAVASSLNDVKLPKNSVFIGEIGLLGEIRAVSYLDRRITEAKRLGFTKVYSRKSHTRISVLFNELGLGKRAGK